MVGEFPRYVPDAGRVYDLADEVASRAGDVDDLAGWVGAAHSLAQDGVAGLLDGPMADASVPVTLRAFALMQASMWAAGAVRLFAGYVHRFNNEVEALRYQWLATDFGVERGEDEEFTDYRERLDDAQSTTWRVEFAPELEALQEELRGGADLVTWYLVGGISRDGLVELYNAGALPGTAWAAFPGSDFMLDTDPRQRWDSLVQAGVLPEDATAWSAEDVVDFLEGNPEMAAEFEVLLYLPTLSGNEGRLVEGYADYHAGRFDQGLRHEPGTESQDLIAEGVSGLRAIDTWVVGDEWMAGRGRLTDGQRLYYERWYDAVGAEGVAALPGHVDGALPEGALGAGEDRHPYVTPVANGIMHLSNPDVTEGADSERTTDDMPDAIQDLVTMSGRGEHARPSEPSHERSDPSVFDGEYAELMGRFHRYDGFAEVMDAATVQGGTDFTVDLAVSAIRVRDTLSTIVARAQEHGLEIPLEGFMSHVDDSGASTMLGVVARDPEASAVAVSDAQDGGLREQLLGLEWDDTTGVAEVFDAAHSSDG